MNHVDVLTGIGYKSVDLHTFKSDEFYAGIGISSEHYVIINLCPIKVFDRWANSRHMKVSLPDAWRYEAKRDKIRQAEKILRRIPQKYFLRGLYMEY